MNKNLATGIFLSLFGLLFASMSLTYPLGSIANMGPGLFPLGVSLIIICSGLIFCLLSLKNNDVVKGFFKIPFTLLLIILSSGIISNYLGLLTGINFLILSSSMLHRKFNIALTLILILTVSMLMLVLKQFIVPTLPL